MDATGYKSVVGNVPRSCFMDTILFLEFCTVQWLHLYLFTCMRKNCSSDREFFLKFEAEGQEFAKILRSLEQFVQTVKGQNNFWLGAIFILRKGVLRLV